MTAVEIIDAEVRDVVRRQGLDPVSDPAAVRRVVDEVVAAFSPCPGGSRYGSTPA